MILVISSDRREREAFVSLCESRGWTSVGCESVRNFKRMHAQKPATTVLTRHRLADGYSDDVLAHLRPSESPDAPAVMVLLSAEMTAAQEARQLALGARCVLRDPVRTEVLLEYIGRESKPRGSAKRSGARAKPKPFPFAGAQVDPNDRQVRRRAESRELTPRELQLVQALAHAQDEVVSYDELYREVLGRPFHGDTSNMRVLLGKLDETFRALGINLRDYMEVIAKTGYRYRARKTRSNGSKRKQGGNPAAA